MLLRRNRSYSWYTLAAFLCATFVAFAQTAPRVAPDLTMTEPSGAQTRLSSYSGKVTVVEFLFTSSPHCQELARLLAKLQVDLASSGFQAVGVAIDGVLGVASPQAIADFARQYGLSAYQSDSHLAHWPWAFWAFLLQTDGLFPKSSSSTAMESFALRAKPQAVRICKTRPPCVRSSPNYRPPLR